VYRQQVFITGDDHVRRGVQRDFQKLVVFLVGWACLVSTFVLPVIRSYSSADMITVSSPFLRRDQHGFMLDSIEQGAETRK
jgi:hypothetical protein